MSFLESDIALEQGEAIAVDLPDAGMTAARVIWSSGPLFGCQFDHPLSSAALIAAELSSAIAKERVEAFSHADDGNMAVSGGDEGLRRVLGRAVATNILNPHPYLFWGTAGAQLLLGTWSSSGAAGAGLFLAGFYALLVGSKLLVALLVSRSRGWLRGRGYRRVLAASGALLAGLGLLLAGDGVRALLRAG